MKASPLAALVMLGIAAGCANNTQPPNVENACAIFDQRPHWERAVIRSERKWGAPANVQLAIIWKESSFRPDVHPRRTYFLGIFPTGYVSSAYGFSQALDGTWAWYKRETGNSGADREDFFDTADFVGWYMSKSRDIGIAMDDAYNQYLAYHEGHAGWKRGTWKSKTWLTRVASEVHRKAADYKRHIEACT